MKRIFDGDPVKRARLIANRGIDLFVVSAVFDDPQRTDYPDTRFDYGEERRLTVGKAEGRAVTVVYTIGRGDVARHRLAVEPEGASALWPTRPISRFLQMAPFCSGRTTAAICR